MEQLVSSVKSKYEQLSLFNEPEASADASAKEPEQEEVKAYCRKKSRAAADRLPADLPMEIIEHTLPEGNRFVQTAAGKVSFGGRTTPL